MSDTNRNWVVILLCLRLLLTMSSSHGSCFEVLPHVNTSDLLVIMNFVATLCVVSAGRSYTITQSRY